MTATCEAQRVCPLSGTQGLGLPFGKRLRSLNAQAVCRI